MLLQLPNIVLNMAKAKQSNAVQILINQSGTAFTIGKMISLLCQPLLFKNIFKLKHWIRCNEIHLSYHHGHHRNHMNSVPVHGLGNLIPASPMCNNSQEWFQNLEFSLKNKQNYTVVKIIASGYFTIYHPIQFCSCNTKGFCPNFTLLPKDPSFWSSCKKVI